MNKIMPNRLDRGFYLYQEEFEQKAVYDTLNLPKKSVRIP